VTDYSDRIAALEAQPQLGPAQRGELRAMARYANPDEQERIERLLHPRPDDATSASYERGLARGQAANRR
jgi:hypothetical protein